MKKFNIDIKTVIIIILSIVVLVLAFGLSLLIMHNIKGNKYNEETTSTSIVDNNSKRTGIVTKIEDGYVFYKEEGSDVEEKEITNCYKLKAGDTITYTVDENGKKSHFECIYEVEGTTYKSELYEHRHTNTRPTSSKTTTEAAKNLDEEVLHYIIDENNKISTTTLDNTERSKTKAKEYFVSLVDFIFYGGKIKDHTFAELSDETKEKVLYLTLKIDSSINKNIPGYKDTLSDSYKNAKNQLLAKYTEYTTNLCKKNSELCDDLKQDTEDLKTSLNITWDILKDIFNEILKPEGAKGLKKLSDWYEVWKNA